MLLQESAHHREAVVDLTYTADEESFSGRVT